MKELKDETANTAKKLVEQEHNLVEMVKSHKDIIFEGIQMYIYWIAFVVIVFFVGFSSVPEEKENEDEYKTNKRE